MQVSDPLPVKMIAQEKLLLGCAETLSCLAP